ncbi:hypothetical protein [Aeromicrobium sp.]|uniref:hypothetical protein n=1 Tax=Aeromicrobium sp. TaxID=1871063 RepID=UPI002FC6C146
MLTRVRAAVLVVAGLTLAACGNTHPGAAAVVDNQTISMKSLDKAAEAYCTLTLPSAQGATPPSNADMRRQALTMLVSLIVARKIAEEEGITPQPGDYELSATEEDQVAEAFPKEKDLDELHKLIEQSRELSAITLNLGEKRTGQKPTPENEAQIGAVGEAEITKAFKANGVEFAPRFGLSNSTAEPIASTGSLSVAPTDLGEEDKNLPATQRCT